MKVKSLITLSLFVVLFIGAFHYSVPVAFGATKQILVAAKVKSDPTGLDDSSWEKAKAIAVPFDGKESFAGKHASVTTKALYTKENIFFLYRWKDADKSITKGAWKLEGKKWIHQKGSEDRISMLFEINRINNFATKGCAIVCHVPEGAANAKDGKFGTTSAAQKGDLWHWKAARSNPAGFADDTWLTMISDKKGGRKGDAGKGGDQKNITEDKSKPKYMPAQGKSPDKDGILLASHAVEITDYTVFKEGDTLTYRMPKIPAGSRADIKATSHYVNGEWTVMLSRKMDTGNPDDTAFNSKRKYNFAMALFDNSGDEDSYDSEVITLKFK
jgi:hypothetical protein